MFDVYLAFKIQKRIDITFYTCIYTVYIYILGVPDQLDKCNDFCVISYLLFLILSEANGTYYF